MGTERVYFNEAERLDPRNVSLLDRAWTFV